MEGTHTLTGNISRWMQNKVSEQQYGSYGKLCCMLKEQKYLTELIKPETTFQAVDSISREE